MKETLELSISGHVVAIIHEDEIWVSVPAFGLTSSEIFSVDRVIVHDGITFVKATELDDYEDEYVQKGLRRIREEASRLQEGSC